MEQAFDVERKIFLDELPMSRITHKVCYIHPNSSKVSPENLLWQLRQPNDKLDVEGYCRIVFGCRQVHGIGKGVAGIANSSNGVLGEIPINSRQIFEVVECIFIKAESLCTSIINGD